MGELGFRHPRNEWLSIFLLFKTGRQKFQLF